MKKIKEFLLNKEIYLYILFGVLTTLVNFFTLKLFNIILGENLYLVSNIIAWIISVIFAYITNKLFVFESKSWSPKVLWHEIPSFFEARVISFLIEEGGLWLLVDVLGMKQYTLSIFHFQISGIMCAKVILAVIVVILNYIFSKLFIFKKK